MASTKEMQMRAKNKKKNSLLSFKSNWKLEKGYKRYIEWYVDFFKKNKDN